METRPAGTPREPEPDPDPDGRLLRVLDEGFRAAAATAGSWLACAPGCHACCIGPFPISGVDARRLAAGLDALARRDPERARRVVTRARASATHLAPGFPGDVARARLDPDPSACDAYFERHAAVPCPVLDPATGRCDLYDARPVPCRVHGPPLRYGDELVPPCELCFRGAPAAVVEACRHEPDPDGLEETLLAGDEDETLVAFALAGGAPDAGRARRC
jgi:Fe-S-cluster containining protein